MCCDGHVEIAWFLVLLPFILLAIVIGLVMANQKKSKKEGYAADPKHGRR
jgi:hypothetical protein